MLVISTWNTEFRKHYIEQLCRLIRQNQLETLRLLTADDLETVVRRQGLKLPPNPYGSPKLHYYNSLLEVACCPPFLFFNIPTYLLPFFGFSNKSSDIVCFYTVGNLSLKKLCQFVAEDIKLLGTG